jgi:SagB-type dehydrogenase family enzyme
MTGALRRGWPALLVLVTAAGAAAQEAVHLPVPPAAGDLRVEEALAGRRSVREYTGDPLTLEDLSALLWAAQGQTSPDGGRTAPSAGARYPVEVRVVAADVQGLEPGVYRYEPEPHSLTRTHRGDLRKDLAEAALGQAWLKDAPVVFVLSAVYERTMKKYGERGVRYAHMEAGAVCENLYLAAGARGLGTVLVGAFHDSEVSRLLGLDDGETPLALMPAGHPREE